MDTSSIQPQKPVNVLLIGNNPMEMGSVLEKLGKVRKRKIVTEIAFDLQTIVERLLKFSPHYILIDDNIGRTKLKQTIKQLASNKKTKNLPITVLKNSNYTESLADRNIIDYLLKKELSAEALYNTLKNSLRFKKTLMYLSNAYAKRGWFVKRDVELRELA